MNLIITLPEIAVVLLGLGLLLLDLWTAPDQKNSLGYVAVLCLSMVLVGTFFYDVSSPQIAMNQMFILDSMALFFKRLFLMAAILVILITMDFCHKQLIKSGVEYFSLILFALAGMMWSASANNFCLLFVSVELITVTFYVLTSFQRNQFKSLESGIKYLILGAAASGFMVYGIALVFGSSGTLSYHLLSEGVARTGLTTIFQAGLVLVLAGLGFKIASFPFQFWVPDVYQGAPIPSVAFLAIGSKAAGFVLILRVLFSVTPQLTIKWQTGLCILAGLTILYGNLCAIPQRSLKRLLGYSSVAQAGYLMMGIAAISQLGISSLLYYLVAYLFSVLAAFAVLSAVIGPDGNDEIGSVAGLNERSPFLALTLTMAMVSLAGIPPLAGFMGKFMLMKATLKSGAVNTACYSLIAVALFGIMVSIYYYFGIIRSIFWSKAKTDTVIEISWPVKIALGACIVGMFYLGLFPSSLYSTAETASKLISIQ